MTKLNGSAKWIMAIIASVSLTFGICSYAFNGSSEIKTVKDAQAIDHTELELLKQKLTGIETLVKDIHEVIYQPQIQSIK